mgnify:FL=1
MVFHSPQYGVNIPTGYDADHITLYILKNNYVQP